MTSEKSLTGLITEITDFRDQRDWRQFHTFKNLSAALSVEASELLELTQWMNDDQAEEKLKDPDFQSSVSNEIADVFIYLLLVCETSGIDLLEAAHRKIKINNEKYPVERSKGTSEKYTKLK
jgi:NTP pyrophosphatase (non-canonical NTP hydrolase)